MVRLENVGKRYADAEVLREVSFELAPGDFCFLTGPQGAGKTSLLKLVGLAETPSQGAIELFGIDVASAGRAARAALRRRVGVVTQDCRLVEHLTVAANVGLPLRIGGASEQEIRDNVGELLAWLGIGGRGAALPSTLSEGDRQRVAIARAIVGRPELLLADEPTGHADPDVASLLVDVFERINRLGATVLIATRDTNLADRSGYRRLRVEDGALSEDAAGGGP